MLTCLIAAAAVLAQPPAGSTPRPDLRVRGAVTRWDEGLPIGNGLMGVLVWGQGPTLRLSLDRADLWDTRLPDIFSDPEWNYASMIRLKNEKNHARHQQLFDVPYDTIPYPTKLPAGRLEIDLGDGQSLTDFSLTPGIRRVGLWRQEPSGAGPSQVGIDPRRAVAWVTGLPAGATPRLVWPAGLKQLGCPDPQRGGDDTDQWFVQTTAQGLTYAIAAARRTAEPPHKGQPSIVGIGVAIVTGAEATDPLAEARARAAAAADAYRNPANATPPGAAWAREFGASSVSIPDPRLQLHYDLCKHFYVCGSRPDAPPMPLQGVWTADEGGLPPWKGDYHNDLNTQMTYAAYAQAGLFDQGLSWINFNWNLLPAYTSFAHEFYGLDQDVPRAIVPGVMTIDGKPMGGWGQYSLSPTHSAWVAQAFYEHWKYTDDPAFLRDRARPFGEAVGNALLGLLREDEHGHPVLPLSTSPEIHDNSYAAWLPPNSNYDLSLLRWLFAALAEMCEQTGDTPAAARWRDALAKLDPLDVDPATGLTFARGHPYAQSHRHFSHAMAVWPLGTLTIDGSDADRAAIAATLDRLDATGTKQWCGYSFAWMSAMAARAAQPERALDYLTKYLAFTGPNGFHLNGDQTRSGLSDFTYRPFTLEGNFIAMQAVHEMLLQSWGEVGAPGTDVVRVFPAVSDRWRDVRFENLRAHGGLRVSAERREGRTVRVTITSDAGGPVRLRDPFAGQSASWNHALTRDGLLIRATLAPGETLEGAAQTATVSP